MTITGLRLERFTVFKRLDFSVSPGINVLVGANGTGKTHIMKAAYAACDISMTRIGFAENLVRVFMPSDQSIGRLVKREEQAGCICRVVVRRDKQDLEISFSNHSPVCAARARSPTSWPENLLSSAYIPAAEVLSNAPGFRSLYAQREIHFEEIYADILGRAYQPALRGPTKGNREGLLTDLQKAMGGKVTIKDGEFFLQSRQGDLEFTLLAEGARKLGLLWLLIRNGTLLAGSTLFWDEPETNLNPKLFGPVIETLLELQRVGVQIFLATHSYVILKELDLRKQETDKIAFHSLYRDSANGEIACRRADTYLDIHPNAIAEAFADLYDREVKRS